MTEDEDAVYDDLVDEVDKLNDRVMDLLKEKEALRTEKVAMQEIVQAVAALWVHYDPDDHVYLFAPDNKIDVEELREKARAILEK